jgi:hypothetical protein
MSGNAAVQRDPAGMLAPKLPQCSEAVVWALLNVSTRLDLRTVCKAWAKGVHGHRPLWNSLTILGEPPSQENILCTQSRESVLCGDIGVDPSITKKSLSAIRLPKSKQCPWESCIPVFVAELCLHCSDLTVAFETFNDRDMTTLCLLIPFFQGVSKLTIHGYRTDNDPGMEESLLFHTFARSLASLRWVDTDVLNHLDSFCDEFDRTTFMDEYALPQTICDNLEGLGTVEVYVHETEHDSWIMREVMLTRKFPKLRVLGLLNYVQLWGEGKSGRAKQVNDLCRVFENCPALETVGINLITPGASCFEKLGQVLHTHCPLLTRVAISWDSTALSEHDWAAFAKAFSFLKGVCLDMDSCQTTTADGSEEENTAVHLKAIVVHLKSLMPECHVLVLEPDRADNSFNLHFMINYATGLEALWQTEDVKRRDFYRPIVRGEKKRSPFYHSDFLDSGILVLPAACPNCNVGAGKLRCSRCKQVKYCSRACQKAHWKAHKKLCTWAHVSSLCQKGVARLALDGAAAPQQLAAPATATAPGHGQVIYDL